MRSDLQNAHLPSDCGDNFKSLVDLGASVFAGHDGANTGFTFRDGWEGDASRHHSRLKERFAELHCAAAVANQNRRDWGLALWRRYTANIEAGIGKFLLEVRRVGPETVDAIGLIFKHVERRNTGRRDRRRMRGGEEKRASAMIKVIDQIAASADVAA